MEHWLAPFWATALRRWGAPRGIFAAAVVFGAVLIIRAAVVQNSTIHVFPPHEINLPE
jgi:hypothetical protein